MDECNICRKKNVSSPKHDSLDKIIRKNLVKDIAIDLVNSKIRNGGRVPHGKFNKHLDCVKDMSYY